MSVPRYSALQRYINLCTSGTVSIVNDADYLHCKFKGLGFNQTTKTNNRCRQGTIRVPKASSV